MPAKLESRSPHVPTVTPSPVQARRSRKRPAAFVVILEGEVIFEHDTMSGAAAWRDGFGRGAIFERVPEPRKAVRL